MSLVETQRLHMRQGEYEAGNEPLHRVLLTCACLTRHRVQRDMEHLVTCSYDGSIAVWEVRSGHGLQPTQLSRWTAHGPASTGLLPSCLSSTNRSTPVQDPAQKLPDTAVQEGLEQLHLQTKRKCSSLYTADTVKTCEKKQWLEDGTTGRLSA